MSYDKSFARFVVYAAFTLGVLASPFAHQEWLKGVCSEVHPTSTKDATNCWWNITHGSDIYE